MKLTVLPDEIHQSGSLTRCLTVLSAKIIRRSLKWYFLRARETTADRMNVDAATRSLSHSTVYGTELTKKVETLRARGMPCAGTGACQRSVAEALFRPKFANGTGEMKSANGGCGSLSQCAAGEGAPSTSSSPAFRFARA